MTTEEFRELYKDELNSLSDMAISRANKISILDELAFKISDRFGIDKLELSTEVRKNKEYLIYKFCFSGKKCCGALEFIYGSLERDLANLIGFIVDGCDALAIINKAVDSHLSLGGSRIDVVYVYGAGRECEVYDWDYSNIYIKLSNDVVTNIVSRYRNSRGKFKLDVESILSSSTSYTNIVDAIKGFNDNSINRELGIRLDCTDLGKLLSKHMISREEAIEFIRKTDKNRVNLKVVQQVDQLGNFLVQSNWSVNRDTWDISISLADDQVIDLDNLEINSNYAICSRIERVIKLKDLELNELK